MNRFTLVPEGVDLANYELKHVPLEVPMGGTEYKFFASVGFVGLTAGSIAGFLGVYGGDFPYAISAGVGVGVGIPLLQNVLSEHSSETNPYDLI